MTSIAGRKARCAGLAAVALAVGAWSWVARGAAPAGHFVVSTDQATVRDTVTGLVWQRTLDANSYKWASAKTYCQGLSFGGFSGGWRLPTRKELESIVDIQSYGPAIDTTAFLNTTDEAFWSSSQFTRIWAMAWYVYFGSGGSSATEKTYAYRVRCVR